MKKVILLLSVVFLMSACGGKKKSENASNNQTQENVATEAGGKTGEAVDGHTSKSVLDWAGSYEGTLPCANCKGVLTNLTLGDDKTFTISEKYLGPDEKFEEKGSFSWDATGSIISLSFKGEEKKYLVGENTLIALDENGNQIEGDQANEYYLHKK